MIKISRQDGFLTVLSQQPRKYFDFSQLMVGGVFGYYQSVVRRSIKNNLKFLRNEVVGDSGKLMGNKLSLLYRNNPRLSDYQIYLIDHDYFNSEMAKYKVLSLPFEKIGRKNIANHKKGETREPLLATDLFYYYEKENLKKETSQSLKPDTDILVGSTFPDLLFLKKNSPKKIWVDLSYFLPLNNYHLLFVKQGQVFEDYHDCYNVFTITILRKLISEYYLIKKKYSGTLQKALSEGINKYQLGLQTTDHDSLLSISLSGVKTCDPFELLDKKQYAERDLTVGINEFCNRKFIGKSTILCDSNILENCHGYLALPYSVDFHHLQNKWKDLRISMSS